MLHWLEVSRPSLPKPKPKRDASSTGSDNKFPDIKSSSKARREWNSPLPVESKNRTSKLEVQRSKYGGLPNQSKDSKRSKNEK